jgi:hypothetical protein
MTKTALLTGITGQLADCDSVGSQAGGPDGRPD